MVYCFISFYRFFYLCHKVYLPTYTSDLTMLINDSNLLQYSKPLHYVPTKFTDKKTLKLYSWVLGYTVVLFVTIPVLFPLFHK